MSIPRWEIRLKVAYGGLSRCLLLALFAGSALSLTASAVQAAIVVPGQANVWLAGMPNGSTASGGIDSAPAESPVLVTEISLTPGTTLIFSASGTVSGAGSGSTGPDGLPDPPSYKLFDGGENGVSGIGAPYGSLLGVFLDSTQPNLSAAPAGLDFRPGGNVVGETNYLTLAPLLKQSFFIGNGLTQSNGPQQILVPDGATRLYLGVMDTGGSSNNSGSFSVQVAAVPEPGSIVLMSCGLLGLVVAARRPPPSRSRKGAMPL